MKWAIETKRLGLRKILKEDFEALAVFLKNSDVMYAWDMRLQMKKSYNG